MAVAFVVVVAVARAAVGWVVGWAAQASSAEAMTVEPEAMEAALDRLDSRWGGFAGYAAAAGVGATTIDTLRAKLVHAF